MGRTLLSSTALIQKEKESWSYYRKALRKEDRLVFDELFAGAVYHSGEIACAGKPYPFESMLISILIEQRKLIKDLHLRLKNVENSTITLDKRNEGITADY